LFKAFKFTISLKPPDFWGKINTPLTKHCSDSSIASSAGLRPERLRPNGAPDIFQFFLCNSSVSSLF